MNKVACLYFPAGIADVAAQELMARCQRFTSKLAHRPGEAVFLDLAQVTLAMSREALGAQLLAWAKRAAAPAATALLAWGQNPGEALALARMDMSRAQELPMACLRDFATPFCGDGAAEQRADDLAAALQRLGLSRLKELPGLANLSRRFGANAELLAARVSGAWDMSWPGDNQDFVSQGGEHAHQAA